MPTTDKPTIGVQKTIYLHRELYDRANVRAVAEAEEAGVLASRAFSRYVQRLIREDLKR